MFCTTESSSALERRVPVHSQIRRDLRSSTKTRVGEGKLGRSGLETIPLFVATRNSTIGTCVA